MNKTSFDVVVVGSGAGGGVVAGELAGRGRDVLLLEAGPHLTPADFTRSEAEAHPELFWPLRRAFPGGGEARAVPGRTPPQTTAVAARTSRSARHAAICSRTSSSLSNVRGENEPTWT